MTAIDPSIRVESQRLVLVNDLTAYISCALLTDARARPDDDVQDDTDLRGWWGDSLPDVPGDSFGSRLWTLKGKSIANALELAPALVREALQCGIEDGLIASLEVRVEAAPPDRCNLWIIVTEPSGNVVEFDRPWQIAIG